LSTDRNDIRDTDIAIVGMACRVPGASDPTAYWRNLRDGVESIVDLDEARLRAAGVSEADLTDPAYVRRAALLDGYDTFDARFFGFTPKDAAILDPQHRHFLEVCWEALESAGYPPGAFEGRVGVFAGSGMHAYFARNLLPNRRLMDDVGLFLVRHTGNDKDFLATRVSYELDLTGPSVNVQTACSTSLVSVHMGCQSLIAFESDLVLAGGVTIELPHERGYRFESGEILAPDGHCRPFDARSGGTLFGSGAGVLVLRRASEALEAGDTIHAIIRGSAINNDGALKVGYLAPSVDGQAAAIAEALEIADVPPATVRFVEAHGTATPVGDPIEITALTQAYGRDGATAGSCVVGSVKSNIGHLDTAAGAASLIKAVEAVKHGQIPPTLHYQAPNPAIDFASSPFYVNDRLIPWPDDPFPRRAGVSSLGVGGTNAHIVVQEAPDPLETTPSRAHQLLVLSARSDAARERAAARLAAHLGTEDTAPTELADVAYTLHLGRQAMASRLALVVGPGVDPAAAVSAGDGARRATAPSEPRELAFLFAGGGAQYPEMGRGLYESEPAYRDALDEALAALPPDLTEPVRALLFLPEGADEAARAAAHTELRRPSRALPALLATQYAQARLWMSWGVTPSAMLGHSMGEYTAACLAGVFTLIEALALVATRGRLFETLPEGGMLSVFLPRDEVEPLLGERLSLAATNAPAINLASGPVDAIEALQAALDARGVSNTRVHIEVAAHSAMLDPILEPFEAFVRTVRLRPPQIPIVSNVTGDWLRDAEATDPTYWVRHLRGTVRFAEGAARLLEDPARALLEVGPGRTLATLSRMNVPAGGAAPPILSSMRHPEATSHDQAFQLGVLGELWCHGVDVDWPAFYGDEVRRRVPLPTYPFEHERYWIAEAERAADPLARKPADQWFYLPAWRRRPLLRAADVAPDGAPADGVAMLLAPPDPTLSAALAEALRTVARRVVVLDGERASAPYAGLAAAARRGTVTHVVHALAVGASDVTGARVYGFESLLALGQALARLDWRHQVELRVLTSGLQDILGEGPENPGMALLLGPASVLPREVPHLRCGVVDVPRPGDAGAARRVAVQVVAELGQPGGVGTLDEVVAYVGASRWVRAFEPAELPALAPPPRAGAVYLVTGGLGGIGLAVAQRLARPGVTLSLIGRSAPNRFQRDALEHLRESGAEVIFDAVDVCDGARLSDHVAHLRATRGRVDGVVHAAGVIDDALMALKSVEAARRVLAPKVDGTLALMRALGTEPLDFMLLFSSVSAFGGLAGQADYAAANAFLDAFASQQRTHGRPVTAVAWPAWREVGMAAELAAPDLDSGAVAAGARPCAHPLLDRLVASTPSGRIYETDFSVARHWLLDEHRIRDAGALIPGTGFMELARAAFLEGDEAQPVSLWDVGFESPFDVADDETRTLRITLRYRGRRTELVMQSTHPAGGVVEHLRGELEFSGPGGIAPPAPVDLEALRARCTRGASERPGEEHEAHLVLGPRWVNLTRLELGEGEALVTLALRGEAAADAGEYGLHPALLDMATASAQSLVEGFEPARDFYVPLGYRALHWYAPLGTELFSHIRLRLHGGSGGAGGAGSDGLAVFDATLCDGEGTVLAEVSELTMRRVDRTELVANLAQARLTPAREAATSRGVDPALQRALALGLGPEEALGALDRVLAQAGSEGLSAVAIVPQDLTATLRALRGEAEAEEPAPHDTEDAPDAEGFVAPEGALETRIAAIWAEALGIRHVSADADFFALGGHSLVAIRITSRLNQAFGVDLPLRAIFDSPTVRGLGAELEPLLGEHAEVASGGFSAARAIPRAEPAADGTFAPSAAQESLWFLDQLQPGNPAYNIALALDLRGPLDVRALQVALDSVVERHEVLRTRFVSEGGAPRVIVDPAAPLALEREPLAESARGDAGEVSERVRNWIDRQAARPFDLSRGPLLRAALLEAGPEHHVLSVTMHHIASDEWSLEAFYDELAERYESEVVGRPAALPELSIQYLDFAAWQRAQLEESDLSELVAYWREELAGVPGHIELPTDHPRPPTQRFDGARVVHVVDPEVARRVRALCAERGVTSFVALLAAFQTLLYRLSGQADVVVGSPSSSRSREETERLVGFFVNTLALRARFEDDPSFAELLEATRATVYGAFEHQRLPFDRLVRSLDLPRDPSRNPLFQVLFAVYPSVQHVDLHGLEVTRLHPDHGGAQVDLSLYVEDGDEAMRCIFEYNTALFDRATVDAVHARFEHLLRGIVEAPERRVSELPILPEPERRRLLVEWNDTAAPYDRAACVHELFFREAERNPNAVAVEAGGQSLRYGELAAAARALAARLRRAGAGPGEIVGIYLERSLDMVVGLLGILASGAAYLPLDPEFPADRLAFMLEDSGARVLLAQGALADALPAHQCQVLRVDEPDESALLGEPDEAVAPAQPTPADRAYVIYTSGSTGKPKGVQVQHGAVVNFLTSMAADPGLTHKDSLLAVTTIAFDISVLEVFLPLMVGARLVVATRDEVSDGRALRERLEASKATVMQATPTTWRLLFQAGWKRSKLRVLCGGEAMPRDLARQLVLNAGAVWNMYGPTETTIWSTLHPVEGRDPDVRIGRPIANTRVYVLDEHRQPVPIGVYGELYIGGDGVTLGYVGRPELTAERFLPDPFASAGDAEGEGEGGGAELAARMYRTGDRVRFRRDGTLEYLERIDNQVKVRGFRIELGEIEARLEDLEAVSRAVVSAHTFGPGDTRLVGYVIAAPGATFDIEATREALRATLPEYMVPAMWERLEAFPLTANNKVDRKALPVPGAHAATRVVQPPETETERTLAAIWERTLGVTGVGLQDNFFDLGGHSLLAMTAIWEIERATGHRLNPMELSVQTLMQVAAACENAHATQRRASQETPSDGEAAVRGPGSAPAGADAPRDSGSGSGRPSLRRALGSLKRRVLGD
jgi:amino acid adenylation domain-containing protein